LKLLKKKNQKRILFRNEKWGAMPFGIMTLSIMTPSKVIIGVGTLSMLLANRYSEYWRSVKEAILRYIYYYYAKCR
jgi:hypothetical protein